jgi:signal transduction histidine kinase
MRENGAVAAQRDLAPAGLSLRALAYLPFLLLAVSLGVSLLSGSVRPGWTPVMLAATVAAALWTASFLVWVRPERRPAPTAVYIGGRLVLTGLLTCIAPWFGIWGWLAYPESGRYLPRRWVGVGVLGAAATITPSYLGGWPSSPPLWGIYAVITVLGALLVGFLTRSAARVADDQLERDQALLALQEANARLSAALDENLHLQSQVVAQARHAGMLDERARLAGEIHDTLAQDLTGIVTQLQAAARNGESAVDGAHVSKAQNLARSGLDEARRSLQALRPGALSGGAALSEALEQTTTRWSADSGIPATLTVAGEVAALPTETEIALLRMTQEALTNVGKHANASKVGVTLSYLDGVTLLDVRDDGIGFDPLTVSEQGGGHTVGLTTMRDRLARVGADLEVESEPGSGTTLVARVVG